MWSRKRKPLFKGIEVLILAIIHYKYTCCDVSMCEYVHSTLNCRPLHRYRFCSVSQTLSPITSNYNKVKANLLWTHQRSHAHNVINSVIDKICKLSLLVSIRSMSQWSKASLLSNNCAHRSVLVCVWRDRILKGWGSTLKKFSFPA